MLIHNLFFKGWFEKSLSQGRGFLSTAVFEQGYKTGTAFENQALFLFAGGQYLETTAVDAASQAKLGEQIKRPYMQYSKVS